MTEEELVEQKKREQELAKAAETNQNSRDVIASGVDTGVKVAATAFAGSAGAAAVDTAEKVPLVGNAIKATENKVAEGINDTLPDTVKENLAASKPVVDIAKPVVDGALTGGTSAATGAVTGTQSVGKVANGAINPSSVDNLGYDPNFKSKTINNGKVAREMPSHSLDYYNFDNPENNNVSMDNNTSNDSKEKEVEGNFNIVTSPLILFLIVGIIGVLILIFFIIQFYQISIAQDGGLNYAFIDVEHCDQVTITNGEYAGTYDLDEYVAGVIDHEVGGFNNSEVFKAFSVAVRTYLFTRSEIIDNVCYIENGSDTQAYRDTNNEAIIEAVANTTGLVLTNNEELIGTEYDAFCMISKDENYYYIKQNEQAMPVVWVEENVLRWSPVSYLTNICGTSGSGGHGRGMSQYGAYYLASVDGQNFEYILKYYYGNDTEIRSIYIGGGNAQTPVSGNGLAWPLTVMNCSSPFGYRSYLNNGKLVSGFHSGLDIAAAAGTPIYAAKSGKVIAVGTVGGGGLHWSYGNAVKIDSNDGMTIIYAHMLERPMVVVGEEVTIGQQIGKVGSTGNSTGNHLHFQIILNGTNVNPYDYLNHEGLPNTCTR